MNFASKFAAAARSGLRWHISRVFRVTSVAVLLASASQSGLALAQTQNPVTINCPPDIIADCPGPQGATVSFTVAASSSVPGAVNVKCVPSSGSIFPMGVTTVKCSAVDSLRNSAVCSFTVTVNDSSPPVITVPAPIVVQCALPEGQAVDYTVSAVDNCDTNVIVICSPPSGSFFPLGTTIVHCQARDTAGNGTNQTFTVTVSSACPTNCIAIACPTNIVVPVERGHQRVVDFTATATNSCAGTNVPVTCLPASGSLFQVGTTIVQCIATDGGIKSVCQFTVTITDNIPPKISAPHTITTECTGMYGSSGPGIGGNVQSGALVAFNATATDNADPKPNIQCVPPSGSFFPLGTNFVLCTATDASGNQSTAQFSVIVVPGPACEISANTNGIAPVPDNWGFELGLVSWTPKGNAFETNQQPVKGDRIATKRISDVTQHIQSAVGGDYWQDVGYPVGHKGERWIGSAEIQIIGFTAVDETLTGSLLSKPFTVEKKNINFLIGGGADLGNLKAEFLVETNGGAPSAEYISPRYYTVVNSATGHGEEIMHRVNWDASAYLGRFAHIRIVDNSTTGHINIDDFRFDDVPPEMQTVTIGDTTFPAVDSINGFSYDWDSPVWGFADMHTHPMSYLGFSGKIMHGKSDGSLADLGDCNCDHGGWGADNTCGNYWRQILQMAMDNKGNGAHREGWVDPRTDDYAWKQFRNWPAFSTVTHQQMFTDWIRRAYDGGLRVMVALCVNNPLLAHASRRVLAGDDKTVSELQIGELKSWASDASYYVEIAYDPWQLRDIVRRGKLAIIIGSELDDFGNFAGNPAILTDNPDAASKAAAVAEIQRMYDLGVRYIFPVHLMDNKFGGTAIGNDMLNFATKYLMGRPFAVTNASPGDGINFRLTDFNNVDIGGLKIDTGLLALTAVAAGGPLISVLGPIVGSVAGDMTPVGPGAGAAIGAGLGPTFTVGLMGALPAFIAAIADSPIPLDIAPLPGNYPSYPDNNAAPFGVRNARGLSDLGRFAIREMMKRGMMIDVDHMSQETIGAVFNMAEGNFVGYPLNSGHNSFRELGIEVNENHRAKDQLERVRKLGGLMGVGWENGPAKDFSGAVPSPVYSRSSIDNDSSGTSKTFGQLYLYALEQMHGSHVAFGTDMDGLIAVPGPRFGPQGAFALPDHGGENISAADHIKTDRAWDIGAQDNGVVYAPQYGKPLTTAAFVGNAVDPDRELAGPRYNLGYRYNKNQRDFYAAIRIFYWYYSQPDIVPGYADALNTELEFIQNGLSGNYEDPRRVKEYAFGMIKALTGWDTGMDVGDSDAGSQQQIGKAVVRHQLFGEGIPDYLDSKDKWLRYYQNNDVWSDYQKIFGGNTPMIRCSTDQKEWDINFEGVAHYGLLPDFIQDLANVGLETEDRNVLFRSAEDFAQMWTKTMIAAPWAGPHFLPLNLGSDGSNGGQGGQDLVIHFDPTDDNVMIEETSQLGNGATWSASTITVIEPQPDGTSIARVPLSDRMKFYRLKKL